jgi:hypothetical protein
VYITQMMPLKDHPLKPLNLPFQEISLRCIPYRGGLVVPGSEIT